MCLSDLNSLAEPIHFIHFLVNANDEEARLRLCVACSASCLQLRWCHFPGPCSFIFAVRGGFPVGASEPRLGTAAPPEGPGPRSAREAVCKSPLTPFFLLNIHILLLQLLVLSVSFCCCFRVTNECQPSSLYEIVNVSKRQDAPQRP